MKIKKLKVQLTVYPPNLKPEGKKVQIQTALEVLQEIEGLENDVKVHPGLDQDQNLDPDPEGKLINSNLRNEFF